MTRPWVKDIPNVHCKSNLDQNMSIIFLDSLQTMYLRLAFLVTLLACSCSISASEDTCRAAALTTIINDVSSKRPNMKSNVYDVIITCVLDGNYKIPPPSEEVAESFIKTQEQIGKWKNPSVSAYKGDWKTNTSRWCATKYATLDYWEVKWDDAAFWASGGMPPGHTQFRIRVTSDIYHFIIIICAWCGIFNVCIILIISLI